MYSWNEEHTMSWGNSYGVICNSLTMGKSALADIYTQA